jgi:hypothetical protein
MATLRQVDPQSHCNNCGAPFNMWREEIAPSFSDPYNAPPRYVTRATPSCYCHKGISNGALVTNIKAKETKLAKQFDTTEVKNNALNTIQSSIDKLERALFDRAVALGKVEAEHKKLITDTSLAFDRVLMEAIQTGIDGDDVEKHLPNYAENLRERMAELIELVQLANVEELV